MTTNKLHLLNEQTVIRGIARNEIDAFSDIPEHLITDKVIRQWVMSGSLEGVPLNRMDDDIRELAISSNPENITYFSSSSCSNYEVILGIAMKDYFFRFGDAEIDKVTPEILASANKYNTNCISVFFEKKAWDSEKQRLRFIDLLVVEDAWILTSPATAIKLSEVSDKALAKGFCRLSNLDFFVKRILEAGRFRVFELMASYDRWPGMKKPHDLMSAIWKIMKVKHHKAEFHMLAAYIKQYPIEDVCQFMGRGRLRQQLLAEIFPSEVVMPHIQKMQHAKRHLLSCDLDI